MNKRIAIGHQDFEEIRNKELYYVDKSDFIRRIYEVSIKYSFFLAQVSLEKHFLLNSLLVFLSLRVGF